MPRERRRSWRGCLALAVVGILVGLGVTLIGGRRIPDGPEPVAWNRQPCAHCRMLVGEPAYAAQLITTEGTVEHFDDHGCLLRYLDEHAPRVHRLWFHDRDHERWWSGDEVRFVSTTAPTPMGYGLVAVTPSTAAAFDLATARRRLAGPRPQDGSHPHGGAP
jgi:copper chaperone NosL